jgi:CHAT domain-containing protein/tetratricopeptide (TPR) repeat protein
MRMQALGPTLSGLGLVMAVLMSRMVCVGAPPPPPFSPVETRFPSEYRMPDGRAMPSEVSLAAIRDLKANAQWDPAFNTAMAALGWTWGRTRESKTRPMPREEERQWLNHLVEICRRVDEQAMMELAVLRLEELTLADHPVDVRGLISLLGTLAEVRYRIFIPARDLEGSVAAADRALTLAHQAQRLESEEAGRARVWRGLSLFRLDRDNDARVELEAARTLADRVATSPEYRLLALGALALFRSETEPGGDDAYRLLQEAVTIVGAESVEPFDAALAFARAGYEARRLGRLEEAIELLTLAVPRIDRETGWRHGHRHRVWLELGRALSHVGRFRDAYFALQKALDLAIQSDPSPRSATRMEPLLEMIRLRRWAGDMNGASERIVGLLANLPVESGVYHPLNVQILLEAAYLRRFRGEAHDDLLSQARAALDPKRPAIADRLAIESAALSAETHRRPPVELVPVAAGLVRESKGRLGTDAELTRALEYQHGSLLLAAGQPQMAVAALRQATPVRGVEPTDQYGSRSAQRAVGQRVDDVWRRRALIQALQRLKQFEASAAEIRTLEKETSALLREILAVESETLRLTAGRNIVDLTSLAIDQGNVPLAAELALRRKGLVIESLLVDDDLRLVGQESQSAAAAVRAWRRQGPGIEAPAVLLRSGFSPVHAALPQEKSLVQLEAATGVVHSAWRALEVRLRDVQRALSARTALIEFVGFGDEQARNRAGRYVAFVITRDAEPTLVHLGDFGHAFRATAALPAAWKARDEAALGRLARELIWPILPHVPQGLDTLVIAPFSKLHLVPFSVLPMPDGRALVERFEVVQVATGRDLLVSRPRTTSDGMAVVAGPVYASTAARVELASLPLYRSAGLHDLPAARAEGEAVARAFATAQPKRVEGWQATEPWVRLLDRPRWLHFATHAFILPPPDPFSAEAAWLSQPMERAALALAGAGDTLAAWFRGERPASISDGILTAAEVGNLNLKGTELVVVSACQSAIGTESEGDGILGLGRGFFRAGAKQVIMSLAEVEDRETAVFMTQFYARLSRGESPARALAEVQRERIVSARVESAGAAAVFAAGPWMLGLRGSLDGAGTRAPDAERR